MRRKRRKTKVGRKKKKEPWNPLTKSAQQGGIFLGGGWRIEHFPPCFAKDDNKFHFSVLCNYLKFIDKKLYSVLFISFWVFLRCGWWKRKDKNSRLPHELLFSLMDWGGYTSESKNLAGDLLFEIRASYFSNGV